MLAVPNVRVLPTLVWVFVLSYSMFWKQLTVHRFYSTSLVYTGTDSYRTRRAFVAVTGARGLSWKIATANYTGIGLNLFVVSVRWGPRTRCLLTRVDPYPGRYSPQVHSGIPGLGILLLQQQYYCTPDFSHVWAQVDVHYSKSFTPVGTQDIYTWYIL